MTTDCTDHASLSTYAIVPFLGDVIRTYALFLDVFIHTSHLYKLQLVGIECSSGKVAANCLFNRFTFRHFLEGIPHGVFRSYR